jgi:hypothetical protein
MPTPTDNKPIAKKTAPDLHPPTIAPERPAEAQPGMELLCEKFETGGAVVGKVLGVETRWVRVRIDELGRDWLILKERIDLAKGSWEHVAADYPAPAEEADFDRQFRPSKASGDAGMVEKVADAAAKLMALVPPDLRADVERLMRRVEGKTLPVPGGSVYARWMGRGIFAGPYISADTREPRRDAPHGTEGFFPIASVQKWQKRQPGSFIEL